MNSSSPRLIVLILAVLLLPIGSATTFAQISRGRDAALKSTSKRWAGRRLVKIRARSGDTLNLLGDRFGVSGDEIAELNGTSINTMLAAGRELLIPLPSPEAIVRASAARMDAHDGSQTASTVGSSDDDDPVWEKIQGVWFRSGSAARITLSKSNETAELEDAKLHERSNETSVARVVESADMERSTVPQPVWIFLVGGARVEADAVNETREGVWYTSGPISIFIERSRIERIERERAHGTSSSGSWTERGWTTGNAKFDSLIKDNGARFGVDPYLIFCVMEQESRFKPRIVSPKGARGLMQLMPGTGARFGVRHPFDPGENIMGGTRYLKQLLENFGGRVDLVLAGYNAGEGAVAKFGGNVPPYRETRNYVQRISKRYGQTKSGLSASPDPGGPGLR
ncbi:MAG: hypothetical protein QOJ64_3884 [Acidobacteriota bacterium]|nr:hypothetical protein [Acidobacteriota bacterium]